VNVEDQLSAIVDHADLLRVGPLIRDIEKEPSGALLLGIVSFFITVVDWKTDSISKYAIALNAATLE
jgi:hypothetical protein